MKKSRLLSMSPFVIAVAACFSCPTFGDDPAPAQRARPARLDVSKSLAIEAPVERLLATTAPPAAPDAKNNEPKAAAPLESKIRIESPTKRVVASAVAPAPSPSQRETLGRRKPVDNPRVQPGKVRWHASFANACAAGRRSGKPVLLFQMMGNLDDRFC